MLEALGRIAQFLLAGWLLNIVVCIPYWWFVERRAAVEGRMGPDVELALFETCLGTIVICLVPWIGGLFYSWIIVAALLATAAGWKPSDD